MASGKKTTAEPQFDPGGLLTQALEGNVDLKSLLQQFKRTFDTAQVVANDPLGILGHPLPTPAERKVTEALAKEFNRPPKLCRRALLKSGHDVAAAKKLLSDLDFCRRHVDYPIDLGSRFRNPYLAQIECLRIEAPYLGRSEQDISPQVAKLQKRAEQYDKKRQAVRQKGEAPRTLKDPVFGNLKWDDFAWEGTLSVPGFGRLALTVEADNDLNLRTAPDARQHNAMQKFLAGAKELRKAIEQANFKYLQRVRKGYDDSGMPVPQVSSPDKLWRYLSTPAVVVPPQRGRSWRVELTWNCTWDEEHGHLVGIRDGKVVHVGLQGDGW
jgi:hypothetical protein